MKVSDAGVALIKEFEGFPNGGRPYRDMVGVWSNVATVSVTVTPVNDAPVAVANAATVAESGATAIDLAANDTDVDNALDLTSIQIVAGPANGSVVINGDGTVNYTHNGSETTADSFTYTIRDAAGAISNVATVSLAVTPVNDAPVALADAATVAEGGATTIDLADNDPTPTTADRSTRSCSPAERSVVVKRTARGSARRRGTTATASPTDASDAGAVSNLATRDHRTPSTTTGRGRRRGDGGRGDAARSTWMPRHRRRTTRRLTSIQIVSSTAHGYVVVPVTHRHLHPDGGEKTSRFSLIPTRRWHVERGGARSRYRRWRTRRSRRRRRTWRKAARSRRLARRFDPEGARPHLDPDRGDRPTVWSW